MAISLSTPVFAQTTHPEDAAFVAAREAFVKGERNKFARAASELSSHPLLPWVDYFRLSQRLEDGSDSGMAEFVDRHNGTYLGEKARGDWLKWLMRQEDWSAARVQFAHMERPDAEAQCRGLDIRLRLGEVEAMEEIPALLSSEAPLAEACRPPLERLARSGALPNERLWERLRRQLALGKLKEARTLASWLPTAEAPAWRTIEAIDNHPARYLAKLPERFADSRSGREQALFAVLRMARTDVRVAASRWVDIEASYPAVERGAGWGWLAYRAAIAHQATANDWFDQAGKLGGTLDEEQRAWRVRSALRNEDWPRVLRAIAAMPSLQATQPEWLYWQGRAHSALGQRDVALALFQRIAGQASFYGILASEALGKFDSPPAKAAPISETELTAAQANPGLVRGLALIRTGMRIDGIREWNWPLARLSDRELLAAAELARREAVIDRAINTADRTRAEHDFSLRYPTPFYSQVEPHVRNVGLDPAWVYGLMRQESRFIMDAKSSAGAKGLMQLMPATAKWVAKKIGMADYHPTKVTDMDTNVALGTHYMKMVMDSLDNHPVLASAAYNAGPGRARKWRGERPLEGAIYAETIPFNETRDYVKKVLANAVHYAALMGTTQPTLTQRLGTVRPRGFSDGTAEDLP
ncbi:MAG: transglycosylase SLT domain-containing protein [Rhodocyclaceae bacterium]|nr:transglycosylase SLT domain-containing protein [Rhodocyclaceae bacterium]MDZ4216094.1 transglycosylase SLT domain-containing protein [Rhodocyclaceae bacterium]